jgi:hypothetical protein
LSEVTQVGSPRLLGLFILPCAMFWGGHRGSHVKEPRAPCGSVCGLVSLLLAFLKGGFVHLSRRARPERWKVKTECGVCPVQNNLGVCMV